MGKYHLMLKQIGGKAAGIILDFAACSIITEGNAAQYYPDYAYNHPLFTPDMKIYSDSTILSKMCRHICHKGEGCIGEMNYRQKG
ncbi:MAG: hypothetical protein SOS50_08105 [Oliverpabstia sp.]|nr:hypothetical protein [Oliverpabstia sp.]